MFCLPDQSQKNESDATAAVPEAEPKSPIEPDRLVIDVNLPDLMADVFLDPELEAFLDQVIATGIFIY